MLFRPLRVAAGRFLHHKILPRFLPDVLADAQTGLRTRLMNWDYPKERDLFIALIGHGYGPEPETQKARIRSDKLEMFRSISDRLALGPADTVLDLGSGLGFGAVAIAPRVRRYHCADISRTFLDYCKKESSGNSNVHYHHIRSGNLSPLAAGSISKGFATAVFIHLNFYDIALYFEELSRVLAPGGKFYFSIMDDSKLDTARNELFLEMLGFYRQDRSFLFNLVYWNSVPAVCRLAEQRGFAVQVVDETPDGQCDILLEKASERRGS